MLIKRSSPKRKGRKKTREKKRLPRCTQRHLLICDRSVVTLSLVCDKIYGRFQLHCYQKHLRIRFSPLFYARVRGVRNGNTRRRSPQLFCWRDGRWARRRRRGVACPRNGHLGTREGKKSPDIFCDQFVLMTAKIRCLLRLRTPLLSGRQRSWR